MSRGALATSRRGRSPLGGRGSAEVEIWRELVTRLDDEVVVGDDVLEERAAYERFHPFVRDAWRVVEPHVPFVDGIHVEAMCVHAEAVTRGEIRNLLITLPPRFTKSLVMSVVWHAWEWTTKPWLRYLTVSYNGDLALDFSVRARRLMMSAWYQRLWGDRFRFTTDQNVKGRYENDRGGVRKATSMDGTMTGWGGDRVVCDDPHLVDPRTGQALASEGQLEEARNLWDKSISGRVNDPNTSARIVLQQRIHPRDLAGHIIEQGTYVHLNLPQEHDGNPRTTAIGWSDPRTEKGQLLCPERLGPVANEEEKVRLGPAAYAAQQNQRPSNPEGVMFRVGFWARWTRATLPTHFEQVALFVDSASGTIGKASARTSIQLWAQAEHGWYLLWAEADQWDFPDLIERLVDVWRLTRIVLGPGKRPTAIVVEGRSTGPAIVATLRKRTRLPIRSWNPPSNVGKEVRASASTGYHRARMLHVPVPDKGHHLTGLEFDVEEVVYEHTEFPTGQFSDHVDAMTLMLHFWEISPPEDGPRVLSAPAALQVLSARASP